jgi:hypothetical protein
MGSKGEVKEDSNQGAGEDSDQNEERAWLPPALFVERLEIVRQEAKEGLLQIRLGVTLVHREESFANLLRRDMTLRVHD